MGAGRSTPPTKSIWSLVFSQKIRRLVEPALQSADSELGSANSSTDSNVESAKVGMWVWANFLGSKGVYPQSHGSLATVDIDALKRFVDLWVHLSFAIFAIFDGKRELKLLDMACDQVQTCLIFPL